MGLDSYTKLCSHFDGADGATAYTDPVAGAYTFAGTAQLDTAQKKFGTASLLLDGNSDYVTLPDSADWNFGTGDFTIDCWIYPTSSDAFCICQQYTENTNNWYLYVQNGDVYYGDIASGVWKGSYSTSGANIQSNQWTHIAFERVSTTAKLFINGVGKTLTAGTAFGTNDLGDIASVLYVGVLNQGPFYAPGYIDELRISKGIARWSSNFIPQYMPYGSSYKHSQAILIG